MKLAVFTVLAFMAVSVNGDAGKEYSMPAYPMDKMGNYPGPRAQGGPALSEGVIKNQRKRVEIKRKK